ncbi:hypothetical protein D9615_008863 [Tricholomella constricta]|uniref:Uncharacterized protein n=1 Tax=Tricholomella constricta TaxID=117010 RepID=A0A8H5H032_9AGAR|nr:hypothetical protein D9615_008863 [Tricholomella constricta]
MPHKRAKRSVRENERKKRGEDLAPMKNSLSNEPIPKAIARVLNATKIREEWHNKKRKLQEDGDHKQGDKRRKLEDGAKGKRRETQATAKISIKPGESIQHFNRRVEDDMRPLVKAAVHSSNAVARNAVKADKEAKAAKKLKGKSNKTDESEEAKTTRIQPPAPAVAADKHAGKAKEFQKTSSSAPRRLNDVAQAPPEFKRLPRGAVSAASDGFGSGKRDGVLSMAQRQMMEKERENAITRYREMKARQRKSGEKSDERDRDGADDD